MVHRAVAWARVMCSHFRCLGLVGWLASSTTTSTGPTSRTYQCPGMSKNLTSGCPSPVSTSWLPSAASTGTARRFTQPYGFHEGAMSAGAPLSYTLSPRVTTTSSGRPAVHRLASRATARSDASRVPKSPTSTNPYGPECGEGDGVAVGVALAPARPPGPVVAAHPESAAESAAQSPASARPARSLRRRTRRLGLPSQDFLERRDGDLDLVVVRRLRGDLLEPQARRHQGPHDRGAMELRPQPQQLERDARDDRDGDDPRQHPPQQRRVPEHREHEDGEDHHDQQEVRPAPHV